MFDEPSPQLITTIKVSSVPGSLNERFNIATPFSSIGAKGSICKLNGATFLTVMSAVPGARAVTIPALVTVAIASLVEAHVPDVVTRRLEFRRGVARIAAAAARRPDLLERLIETERRLQGALLGGSPPSGVTLELLTAALGVADHDGDREDPRLRHRQNR